MNRKEREEVFKAINDVVNRINDVSQKLDEVMQKLNSDTNESLVDCASDLLYQVCLLQLGISDDDVSINK